MSKRIFNEEEAKQLLENKNVVKCSGRSIKYNTAFKISAIDLYEQGLTSKEIFRQAGFDLSLVGEDHPKDCLLRWNKIARTKGIKGLSETRGGNVSGRPRKKGVTEKERIEYLEAQVAYLKAENDFLIKLRAKRKSE